MKSMFHYQIKSTFNLTNEAYWTVYSNLLKITVFRKLGEKSCFPDTKELKQDNVR